MRPVFKLRAKICDLCGRTRGSAGIPPVQRRRVRCRMLVPAMPSGALGIGVVGAQGAHRQRRVTPRSAG
jgi:hypothetical protein